MSTTSEASVLARRLEEAIGRQGGAGALPIAGARTLSARCMVQIGDIELLLDIEHGAVTACRRGLPLLAEWRFAVRGSCAAWRGFWQPVPAPGYHDLFALAKRGEMRFEGELHPFMAHLQYFKDLLALPRGDLR
jgi:hypothetical protein